MRLTLLAVSAAALALCGAASAADAPTAARAELKAADGKVIGSADLKEAPHGVIFRLEAKGLTPGWHGLHFHEKGDCGTPDFKSAGAHVHTSATVVHGLMSKDGNDSGDLPNLHAAADGTAMAEFYSPLVSLTGAGGRPALLDPDGSSIVIHANADDHQSQPIGGAGARLACGVVK
jgi:Cu-Zn family superoxide dismutase